MMKSLSAECRQKAPSRSLGKMEAIACGVQARFEATTGYSQKVTQETVNIAKSLGVSNTEIEKWVAHRLDCLARNRKIMQEIKSMLQKA